MGGGQEIHKYNIYKIDQSLVKALFTVLIHEIHFIYGNFARYMAHVGLARQTSTPSVMLRHKNIMFEKILAQWRNLSNQDINPDQILI